MIEEGPSCVQVFCLIASILDDLCIHGSKERTGQNKPPLLVSWILESGRDDPWHFPVPPSHDRLVSSVK
jgi:hypothetical protein